MINANPLGILCSHRCISCWIYKSQLSEQMLLLLLESRMRRNQNNLINEENKIMETIVMRKCGIFSNMFSLHSSLNVRDHVSQPYSTTGNIIVLYILIFKFVLIYLYIQLI